MKNKFIIIGFDIKKREETRKKYVSIRIVWNIIVRRSSRKMCQSQNPSLKHWPEECFLLYAYLGLIILCWMTYGQRSSTIAISLHGRHVVSNHRQIHYLFYCPFKLTWNVTSKLHITGPLKWKSTGRRQCQRYFAEWKPLSFDRISLKCVQIGNKSTSVRVKDWCFTGEKQYWNQLRWPRFLRIIRQ